MQALSHLRAKASRHLMTYHAVADCLPHDEAHASLRETQVETLMHDDWTTGTAHATADDRREVARTSHPVLGGQHGGW
jgi:hypothetical protein